MFPRSRLVAAVLNSGGTWTPAKAVGGNLPALWLQADDIAGNDGDVVSSWVSKDAGAVTLAQSDNTKRPLLKKTTNGINGHNTVLFDGSNDCLVVASNLSTASSGAAFAVYRLLTALQDEVLFSSCDEASNVRFLYFKPAHADTGKNYIATSQRSNDTNDLNRGGSEMAINTVRMGAWLSNGTAYTMRLNGAAETITTGAGANNGDWFGDTADRDNFVVGCRIHSGGAGTFFKGDLAELLIYNAALTDSQVSQVEAYLKARYNVLPP